MALLVLHTDGACHGNPGPGGFGAWWEYNHEAWEILGGAPHTTNNRMELAAVVQGIQALKRASQQGLLVNPSELCIRTDSQYVIKGICEWLPGWKKRGWKNSAGKPVKNQDAWQKLEEELSTLSWPHRWEWVKGHSDDPFNDHADALAQEGVGLAKQKGGSLIQKRKRAL